MSILAYIQSATGNDRVSTTNLESRMDNEGYTVARALSNQLFNKDTSIDNSYARVSDGALITNSDFYRSDYIWLENDETEVTTSNATGSSVIATFAFYDKNKNYISGTGLGSVLTIDIPTNAKYLILSYRKSTQDINTAMANYGDTLLPYEAWEGYYYDQALTNPVPDGKLSQNVGGFTEWFIEGGVKSSSQYTGLLKADLRVVDGVVDNGYRYEKWGEVEQDPGVTVESNGLRWVSDTSFQLIRLYNLDLETSTQYLLKFETAETDATIERYNLLTQGTIGTIDASDIDTLTIGQSRVVFTTPATITDDFIRHGFNALPINEKVKLEGIAVYKVSELDDPLNPLTSNLPPSGDPTAIGNSVIQATTRYDLIQADDLTTTDMYDTSDIDNAVPLLVELTGDVQDNPLFIAEDPFCWLLYNEALNATEEEKVEKYLGF